MLYLCNYVAAHRSGLPRGPRVVYPPLSAPYQRGAKGGDTRYTLGSGERSPSPTPHHKEQMWRAKSMKKEEYLRFVVVEHLNLFIETHNNFIQQRMHTRHNERNVLLHWFPIRVDTSDLE